MRGLAHGGSRGTGGGLGGRLRGRLGRGATVLTAIVLLAGCTTTDDDPDAPPSDLPTASTSASGPVSGPVSGSASVGASTVPTLEVPAGVALTDQGSALELGDQATVAYQVNQSTVGVLDITVTDLRRTTFQQSFQGWKLDKQLKQANPYFVEAIFKNRGETDLGGQRPPLYIVDADDTLVESSTFVSDFEACPSTDFPKAFEPGDRIKRCLVFLAPDAGELVAVSFRPAQEFNPITWSGEVLKLGVKRPGEQSGKRADRNQNAEKDQKQDRDGS